MASCIRVRYPPSPTGSPHVGQVRTALFNWLFARHEGGTFVFRIEDTDRERSHSKFEREFVEALRWLGLDWDEGIDVGGSSGPYRQSERFDLYRTHADRLAAEGKLYRCYCRSGELEAMRAQALAKGQIPRYDGGCRTLTEEDRRRREAEGIPYVWRFLAPREGVTVVHDLVRGDVTFDNAQLDDLVVVRSGGIPTYNFAVVVDDYTMKISHVVRGEDHISNTPRQLALYDALGWSPPLFAHLPLLHGPDHTKLSKRHGATSVLDFRTQGFLPDAMVNYLVLLGWSPGEEKEDQIYNREELIKMFSLERVTKNPAIFDGVKLEWMNGVYVRKFSPQAFCDVSWPLLQEKGWVNDRRHASEADVSRITGILRLEQERVKKMSEIPEAVQFFFESPASYDPIGVSKVWAGADVADLLGEFRRRCAELPAFGHADIEVEARALCQAQGKKLAELAQATRLAITGRTASPPLFATMEVVGREGCLLRLDAAIAWLNQSRSNA